MIDVLTDGQMREIYGDLSAVNRLADVQKCGIVTVHPMRKMKRADSFERKLISIPFKACFLPSKRKAAQ